MSRRLISVVTPVFNESENIPHFYKALADVVKSSNYDFEVLFVDDGSTDKSVAVIGEMQKTRHNNQLQIKALELSRNFGKEIATTAGIKAASGDAVIIIDSDLQHPIGCIPQFIKKWEDGFEVVIGVRTTHGHYSIIKKFGSTMFYRIMNRISETKIVPHSTDYRLLDRSVVDAFNKFTEHQRITRGLIDWLGFNRGFVEFEAGERLYGQPSYSTTKLVKLALNSFTSHSMVPLRLAGYIGVIFMVFFGITGLFAYVQTFLLNDPLGLAISGTAVLGLLMLFSIGIVLACLGLIALYIANIHGEVNNRPLYVVRPKNRHINTKS